MTRKMKDSGVEWIGEIPEDWEVSKLKHIGFFSASGIDKKIKKNENRVKIVNYVDIYHSKNKLIKNYNYMEVTASSEKIKEHNLIKGDALFTPSSETIEEIGYSAIIDEGLMDTSYSYHLLRFRFNKEIVHNYKRFMFSNESLLNQFASRARGTTRKTLNRIDFEEAVVPLPSKIEQKSIANFLDKKTQEIDNIISKTKKAIEEYKKYKQSLITETVTKGLNKDAPMKDSGIEWIGEIPEDWEIVKLKSITKSHYSGGTPTASKEEFYSEDNIKGFPFVNISDITDQKYITSTAKNITIKGIENKNLKLVPKGSLLYAMYASVGKLSVSQIDLYISQAILAFDATEKADKRYLVYYLNSLESFVDYFSSGTTQMNLNAEIVKNFKVVIPSLKIQQKAIADFLDKKTQEIDQIISTKEKLLTEMEAYKKSLIYETVTGKREVE